MFTATQTPSLVPTVDPWLRPLVSDRLGVAEADLTFHVSLADDLAADSLDFADLAAAMEDALGIDIPTSRLARVRTYGELLEVADTLLRERAERARDGVTLLRTRLSGKTGPGAPVLERLYWLDAYAVEIALDDARHADPGTHLDVVVEAGTPPAVMASVRARLAPLARRGVAVSVRRQRRVA